MGPLRISFHQLKSVSLFCQSCWLFCFDLRCFRSKADYSEQEHKIYWNLVAQGSPGSFQCFDCWVWQSSKASLHATYHLWQPASFYHDSCPYSCSQDLFEKVVRYSMAFAGRWMGLRVVVARILRPGKRYFQVRPHRFNPRTHYFHMFLQSYLYKDLSLRKW